MLLADLFELHDNLVREGRLLPAGFKRSEVHFVVHLASDGHVEGVDSLFNDKGRPGLDRAMPDSPRTSGNNPHIVCDKLEFVAGLPESSAKQDRATTRHANYLALLRECASELGGRVGERVEALVRATEDGRALLETMVAHGADIDLGVLDSLAAVDAERTKKIETQRGWFVDFTVDGEPLLPQPGRTAVGSEIGQWWSTRRAAEDSSDLVGTCQVTGEVGRLARVFPATKLRGNSPPLVSGNFDAALRYGASQSSGANVSNRVAVGATQALNWIVHETKGRHCWSFEELTLAWWIDEDLDLDPVNVLFAPPAADPGEVRDVLIKPIWSGHERLSSDSRFHLAMFTVNTARVVVLADHQINLGELHENLAEWFGAIAPVRTLLPTWRLGVRELAAAAAGPGKNQGKVRLRAATQLIRAALLGERLTISLRNQIVGRCRTGFATSSGERRHVSPEQAAVLHLIATSWKENPLPRTPAELCGRVFAVLEETQQRALGDNVNRGVVATYGAASSTPHLAFPRLLARRNGHIHRLRRDNRGAAIALERKLGELMSELHEAGGFPARLTPTDQAQFALGYFHERQARFTPKSDDPQEKEQ